MAESTQPFREKVEEYKKYMTEQGKNLAPTDVMWLLDGHLLLLDMQEAQSRFIDVLISEINKSKLDLVLRGDEIAQLSAQNQG